MKHLQGKLVPLIKQGGCGPKIVELARAPKEPAATLHYNLRKMEREGVIRAYKAVLDPAKIGEGFRVLALITLKPESYVDPEDVARRMAKHPQVESVDVCTGDWDLAVRLQVESQEAYYLLMKSLFLKKSVQRVKSLVALRTFKSEFVECGSTAQ